MTMTSDGAIRGKILAQWRHLMASRLALDLPSWAMCSALYPLIRMAIKIDCKAGPFFSFVDFMSCITVAKRPCHSPLKLKLSYNIVHYYVISWFIYYGGPPTTMNAVLAIIANGGQAIAVIFREAVEINKFIINFIILY